MEELLRILNEANDKIDYTNEKALIDGGLIDSLELMEIISEIEDTFDVTIGMEDIVPENFNSAQAMYDLIQRLK